MASRVRERGGAGGEGREGGRARGKEGERDTVNGTQRLWQGRVKFSTENLAYTKFHSTLPMEDCAEERETDDDIDRAES